MTAAAAPPACREALEREIASIAGRPRPRERSSRVLRMYSDLHDARADNLVKLLRCARSTSELGSCMALALPSPSASAPGKYLAKAMRHAGGVVTSLWKRREIRLMDDNVSGGK